MKYGAITRIKKYLKLNNMVYLFVGKIYISREQFSSHNEKQLEQSHWKRIYEINSDMKMPKEIKNEIDSRGK